MSALRIAITGMTAALLTGVAVACFSEHVASPTSRIDVAAVCANPTNAPAGVVVIKNLSFNPATITVTAGTTVTWVNCETDAVSHTSTSDTGGWGSSLIDPNTTFDRVFDQAGTFAYHCEPHPFMTGTITVTQ